MYQIKFTKQAYKALRRLPSDVVGRIRDKLAQVAKDPYGQYKNVTKLQNRTGYRLRIGDWRVIYDVEDAELVILVLKVGPRGDIYR